MKSISLTLFGLILALNIYAQGLSITKVYSIEKDGVNATSISEIEVANEYLPFSIIINKTSKDLADEMVLTGDYKFISGKDTDTLRFYENKFSIVDFTYFSDANLTINADSTEYILTNTHRVGGGSKGLTFRNKFDIITYMFVLPLNFKITSIKTTPDEVEKFIQSMVGVIIVKDAKRFEYEIKYSKFSENILIKGERTEKIIKSFNLEKKRYNLELWDPQQIDGDRVNIYINGSIVIPDLEITREKFILPIPLENAKNDYSKILIESQSEGSVGPNTIQGRFIGHGIDQTFKIFTDKHTNAAIEIFVK